LPGAARRRRQLQGGKMAGGGPGNTAMVQDLASVVATAGGETPCDLPTFQVNRPCYLVDLTTTTPGNPTC